MTAAALAVLQQHQVQRALEEFPGHTEAELAQAIGCDRGLLSSVLRDLERAGKAHRAENAFCRRSGRSAPVWRHGPDPIDGTDHLPPELVAGYANALDAMSVPVDPRTAPEPTHLDCAHPIPLYLPATEADTNEA